MAEDTEKTAPGAPEREEHKSEVEILANALAESNKEANSSNKNTVRVLGTLLAFSVLGNFALAGLNITGKFFGTNIEMGGSYDGTEAEYFPIEELGYVEGEDEFPSDEMDELAEEPPHPPEDWCAEMKQAVDEVHPADLAWCKELYPHLWP